MSAQSATVFVVDDDQAVRQSLEMLIKSVGHTVQTYRSAQDFLDAYDTEKPGCLVLDIRMPGMSGLELQKTLRQRHIDIPTIFITGHGDVPVAVRALKDGAFEFLEKPFSKQMLLEHIRDAIKADEERRTQRGASNKMEARMSSLTERERQVMDLVVEGKVNKEIAAALGLSKKTVEVHRANVMQKLQADSIAELVKLVVSVRSSTPPP